MPQEYKIQEALKMAIQAKKNLMDFYNRAAEITLNPAGEKVFRLLAKEVRENAARFFEYYKRDDLGTFSEFMSTPPHPDSAMIADLHRALDKNVHDRRAREIALAEEEKIGNTFRMMASQIIDPAVREIFETVANEIRNHCEMIESEYARTMAMVHETDINTYVRE